MNNPYIFFKGSFQDCTFDSAFNPFSTNIPFLYPLKTSEILQFYVFREYRSGTLVENGLNLSEEVRAFIWIIFHSLQPTLAAVLIPYVAAYKLLSFSNLADMALLTTFVFSVDKENLVNWMVRTPWQSA